MTYKLVIPSAGLGSRIGPYSKFYNKALVSVGLKPAIVHVIERFLDASEIIVILGYEADALRDVLTSFYPNKNIRFLYVDPFEGKGSGLGVTLKKAREFLQCPFVFSPNDTIITDIDYSDFTHPGNRLVFYSKKQNDIYKVDDYRTISLKDGYVSKIHPKGDGTENLYTGLCKVESYELFWKAMDSHLADTVGEVIGLSEIDNVEGIECYQWYDCGNLASLRRTKKEFDQEDYEILEKEDEAIWFDSGRVVKFSKSLDFINDRIDRYDLIPSELVPRLVLKGQYTYVYEKIEGDVLTKKISPKLVCSILDQMQHKMWSISPENDASADLGSICRKFYKDKTYERAFLYFNKYEFPDRHLRINGISIAPLVEVLDSIDWEALIDGAIWSNFHGDFHNENILVTSDGFKLLDWRQCFGSSHKTSGDVYYDLAKFMHGFIVSHPLVNRGLFEVEWNTEHQVTINIHTSLKLSQSRRAFEKWIEDNGYDFERVLFLTALIFVNIAPLHEQPYGEFLHLLGRYMLEGGDV